MPGFNRRGPEGMGPMTGGGRGFCSTAKRSFFGRGASSPAGRGRGLGYNRNPRMGGRTGDAYTDSPYFDEGQEKESLRSQASVLKNELEVVEKRLQELEDAEKTEN
ncbi:DUF5320 domain-containing protein [Thermodesulfobacteriota bacterium]